MTRVYRLRRALRPLTAAALTLACLGGAAQAQADSGPSVWTTAIELGEAGQAVTLHWNRGDTTGTYDWVALFDHYPGDTNSYVSGAWQWATKGYSYTFYRDEGAQLIGVYWTAYISYDYPSGQYRIVTTHSDLLV